MLCKLQCYFQQILQQIMKLGSGSFGAEASLLLIQSTPTVPYDTTRLCWFVFTRWECHIDADTHRVSGYIYIYIYIPNPSAWTGCDRRSIFQRILRDFNSEFSFSKNSCHTKIKEHSLTNHLPVAGRRIVRSMGNAKSLVRDLNSDCFVRSNTIIYTAIIVS